MLGILLFCVLLFITGFLLSLLFIKSSEKKDSEAELIEEINAVLPQTQCGQCGFPGCRPYAEAIAKQEAPINKCPPGGQAGVDALAHLLNIESISLEAEESEDNDKTVAFILEDLCIGCTLCIQACPVDAILGAAKKMHTVITDECTGCELCVSPCPVDCIIMRKKTSSMNEWVMPLPEKIPIRQAEKK